MGSKEESEVDNVTGSFTSENVDESKDLEESIDTSKADDSELEPAMELIKTGKLSDLARANLMNSAVDSLRSDVKIKPRSRAFRELSNALELWEKSISRNKDPTSPDEKIERVVKKTEMLKVLAALSEMSMIDAASVAANYTVQYDLALKEQSCLLSNLDAEIDRDGKSDDQTKVKFALGLKDDNQRDLPGDSEQTAVKCEKAGLPELGRSSESSGSELASGSSDAAKSASGGSHEVESVSSSSDAAKEDPVTNPSDTRDLLTADSGTGELLTATSGSGEQSLDVSEIEPSSEVSEMDPSSETSETGEPLRSSEFESQTSVDPSSETSETGEPLRSSEFERQTSANTQTSGSQDFASMPILSSAQESSAVDSDVLESCSEFSRARPVDASAAVPSAKQESSLTQAISSSTKKKQTDLEGFVFLHLAIEYIVLVERERNNDIDAILAVLFKVEEILKKKIDKQVLRTFKVLFDDIGEGVLKFKNVGNVKYASSCFTESMFSESFLPIHSWSLAGTSASSIKTDSPPPDSLPGESGRDSQLQSSSENSASQSRKSSLSEGLIQDLSRSRSDSLDRLQRPPEKRIRANTPKEGYPFKDGEKSFEFQGTPLLLDGKSSQETSVPKEEGETEVEEKSKSDEKEEKSSGYHEDASKQS